MPDNNVDNGTPKLHEIVPRENAGRDTIARYQAQFRAAAYECLSLLEDDALDRVYCDYQDDYVARLNLDGKHVYNFYQVKTKEKRNYQWTINDIFGLYKKRKSASPEKIANSFAGKLLLHTIKFNNSCGKVVFLTNVHLDDDVEACLQAATNGAKGNNHYGLLLEHFNDAFPQDTPLEDAEIFELLKKLNLEPNVSYLAPDDESFSAIARDTIFKYSEIDLRHGECEEIISNLVALVELKSFSKLMPDISEHELDEIAGVGIAEMLDILSISKGAYRHLKEGGDTQAIKTASIIHRLMKQAGASERMIEFASECKVKWDIWFRNKRHSMAEFDLNFLQEKIDQIAFDWSSKDSSFEFLKNNVGTLFDEVTEQGISSTLTRELLLGGVFAAMVRNESQ
ncbi:MAG: dsDNA nuclease domain-containing protein [Gammaproteobacteria bacterium]